MDIFKETSRRLWRLLFNTTLEGKPTGMRRAADLQIAEADATRLPSKGHGAGISGFKVKSSRFF